MRTLSALPPQVLRRVAAVALALTAAIHLVLTPEYWDKRVWLGIGFALGGALGVGAAAGLWRRWDGRAWALGAVLCIGWFVGFVLARTSGLLGFKADDLEPLGIATLVLEAGFLAAAALATQPPPRTGDPR